MLGRYSFSDAAARFGRGLRLITARAGKPEIYNETITVAFLALIAERLARKPGADWAQFIAENDDLADKNILHRWYEPAELKSEAARKSFIPPQRRSSFLERFGRFRGTIWFHSHGEECSQ